MGKRRQMLAVGAAVAVLAIGAGCAQGVVDSEGDESADDVGDVGDVGDGDDEDGGVLREHVDASLASDPSDVVPMAMPEQLACDSIIDTYHEHGLELGCATTTHTCPDMMRFTFGVACMEYEAPSVNDCVDAIHKAKTCAELQATTCDVHPIWGSEPAGCADVD